MISRDNSKVYQISMRTFHVSPWILEEFCFPFIIKFLDMTVSFLLEDSFRSVLPILQNFFHWIFLKNNFWLIWYAIHKKEIFYVRTLADSVLQESTVTRCILQSSFINTLPVAERCCARNWLTGGTRFNTQSHMST